MYTMRAGWHGDCRSGCIQILMKTFLKLVALFSLAGVPASFAADAAGVMLPAVLGFDFLIGAFVAALAVLTLGTEYAPRRRYQVARTRPHLLPNSCAFVADVATPVRAVALRG